MGIVIKAVSGAVLAFAALLMEFKFMFGEAEEIHPAPVIIFVIQAVLIYMFISAIQKGGFRRKETGKPDINKILAIVLFVLYFAGIVVGASLLYTVEVFSIVLLCIDLIRGLLKRDEQEKKAALNGEKNPRRAAEKYGPKRSSMPALAYLSVGLLTVLLTNVTYVAAW